MAPAVARHATRLRNQAIGCGGNGPTANDSGFEHAGIDADWIGTDELAIEALAAYDGLWIAPSSPYRNMDAALEAIRHARERGVPLVGT